MAKDQPTFAEAKNRLDAQAGAVTALLEQAGETVNQNMTAQNVAVNKLTMAAKSKAGRTIGSQGRQVGSLVDAAIQGAQASQAVTQELMANLPSARTCTPGTVVHEWNGHYARVINLYGYGGVPWQQSGSPTGAWYLIRGHNRFKTEFNRGAIVEQPVDEGFLAYWGDGPGCEMIVDYFAGPFSSYLEAYNFGLTCFVAFMMGPCSPPTGQPPPPGIPAPPGTQPSPPPSRPGPQPPPGGGIIGPPIPVPPPVRPGPPRPGPQPPCPPPTVVCPPPIINVTCPPSGPVIGPVVPPVINIGINEIIQIFNFLNITLPPLDIDIEIPITITPPQPGPEPPEGIEPPEEEKIEKIVVHADGTWDAELKPGFVPELVSAVDFALEQIEYDWDRQQQEEQSPFAESGNYYFGPAT